VVSRVVGKTQALKASPSAFGGRWQNPEIVFRNVVTSKLCKRVISAIAALQRRIRRLSYDSGGLALVTIVADTSDRDDSGSGVRSAI